LVFEVKKLMLKAWDNTSGNSEVIKEKESSMYLYHTKFPIRSVSHGKQKVEKEKNESQEAT
jgi:hypothetical protein